MAQTKTRASSKRSSGSKKPQARSRGSSSKSKKANSHQRTNSTKSEPMAEVAKVASKTTDAVGNAATNVGNAAGKAKIPLVASGAAIAGAAGGMALGARRSRRRNRRGLAKAAKGMGVLGARVGHLATELQRNREATNGHGQTPRSPVEVVLDGLTARRSR